MACRRYRALLVLATTLLAALPCAAQPLGLAAADRARIRAHLAEVEVELRQKDVGHLTSAQRAARSRALDALHGYWIAGEFPRNTTGIAPRVPVFIDAEDRRCAMAHLMIASGHEEVARDIARTQNTARVVEMTDPRLSEWLAANGLTLPEAQSIQPTYCEDRCGARALVCGVDGMTYFNRCAAEMCRAVMVAYEGPCVDGGPAADAGPGEGDAGLGVEPATYGCGCRVTRDGRRRAPFALLAGLLLARRRRR